MVLVGIQCKKLLKSRLNDNIDPNIFYMRTAKGVEVDLIVKKENDLFPYEIKTSMTPNKTFSKHLIYFVEAEDKARDPKIIYAGDSYPKFNGVEYVNYKQLEKYLK